MTDRHGMPFRSVAGLMFVLVALAVAPARRGPTNPVAVSAKLSEWKVELSARTIAAGPVTFTIANDGTIPHAFEVEGQGIEQETALIQPGSSTTLALTLKPGSYEVYCPVGEDSHKKLGMDTRLTVVGAKPAPASGYNDTEMGGSNRAEMSAMREPPATGVAGARDPRDRRRARNPDPPWPVPLPRQRRPDPPAVRG